MSLRIVYACDNNYAALTAISAVSLLAHNPGARIFLLGYRLQPESIELVRSRVEGHGGRFRLLDVSPAIRRLEEAGASAYVSYAVYSRLVIPGLLAEETGKVLYLDCDTLITGALDELFAADLHSHPLALAPDAVHPAYKQVISLPADRPYYNTGVLLFNLDLWREKRCTERLLDELACPHGANPLGDQDVIVRTLNDEILPLDRKWNFLSQYVLLGRRETPVIHHFSGQTLGRPWFTGSKHPMREAYRAAARAADLAATAETPRGMPLAYIIQYALYRLLPAALFRPANALLIRLHIALTYHR